jgi:hypothetical protein
MFDMEKIRNLGYYSFIPLACAECGDSLPFSGVFSILPYRLPSEAPLRNS